MPPQHPLLQALGTPVDAPRLRELLPPDVLVTQPKASSADRVAWIKRAESGVELGFEGESLFLERASQRDEPDLLVLSQIYLHGRRPGVLPYRGELPFGLALGQERPTVRERMRSIGGTLRAFQRDSWESSGLTIVAEYEADRLTTLVLLLSPREPPVSSDFHSCAFSSIVAILGSDLSSTSMDEFLHQMVPPERAAARRRRNRIDLRDLVGVEIIGRPSADGRLKASELDLHKKGQLSSRTWPGGLPFDWRWSDAIPDVLAKASRSADESAHGPFAGWATWIEKEFVVQAHYSTMENTLFRVRVLSPKVWRAP